MSWEGWTLFAGFWALFVTTPGPNAVNCVTNGMTYGFWRSLIGVAAILTQATLFLALSAWGIAALIAASPVAFGALKLLGAAFLIYLGIRGWIMAERPIAVADPGPRDIYWRALVIATINPKSVAGYLAAFSQFVQTDVPIGQQMWVIVPTALMMTTLSYVTYCALGAGIGRAALGAMFNAWLRRGMAMCFIIYGVLLGSAATPGRA